MLNSDIDALVQERDRARTRKDYATADAIRARLLAVRCGSVIPYRIELLDEPQGTFWYWTTRPNLALTIA